jgi:hypothetical protein
MTKKPGPTPEQRAEWADLQRTMEAHVTRLGARIEARQEAEERRRRRLRRLTFGLLGRDAA